MGFDFGRALELLKLDRTVARLGWCHPAQRIGLHEPDRKGPSNDVVSVTFIYLRYQGGHRGPWCPTHTDLLADDWVEVR